jgi:hypothetical protein
MKGSIRWGLLLAICSAFRSAMANARREVLMLVIEAFVNREGHLPGVMYFHFKMMYWHYGVGKARRERPVGKPDWCIEFRLLEDGILCTNLA